MREILGDAKNVRALLSGAKYSIDYYQREYKWQAKHVNELLEDLETKFLESYSENDDRSKVEGYARYFLGSVIISDKDGEKFLIDGQQRLTTLTLILIHIHRLLEEDPDHKSNLGDLIYSERFGKLSFNLDVPERNPCMRALFDGETIEENGLPESVTNIISRYRDVVAHFTDSELSGKALPYFADWLIENVYLVEIVSHSDSDAYTIFETMNDRGLSLNPSDMLKGYLLANIEDPDHRMDASKIWRTRVEDLRKVGNGEESGKGEIDADAIKSWLRSQHAVSIRETNRGAVPRDFDLIGTEFHRWVRDKKETIGLTASADFYDFVRDDFSFFTRWYKCAREAGEVMDEDLCEIFFNARNNFTLQYPVLLSPLVRSDSENIILKKFRIVSKFIDIRIARRFWNFKFTGHSEMRRRMFMTIKEIRGLPVPELADKLYHMLQSDELVLSSNDRLAMQGRNWFQIHQLLARITSHIEKRSGQEFRFVDYIHGKRWRKIKYEIEHILSNNPERHTDEFPNQSDFLDYRNRIGGLLLIPKSFNASYGDKPYEQKREQYVKQNLLAQSLHEKAYEHNPGFVCYIRESGLPFKPHPKFKKADLDERQHLYLKIAEQIWDPQHILEEAEA